MWYIYATEHYSAIKKTNNTIGSNSDGPEDYNTKCSQSDKVKHTILQQGRMSTVLSR